MLERGIDWARRVHEDHGGLVELGVLALVAVVSYFVAKRVVVRGITYAVKRSRASWDDALLEQGVFRHLPFLAPAVVFYFGAAVFSDTVAEAVRRLMTAYIAVNAVVLLDRLLNVVTVLYGRHPISAKRPLPIKSWVQLVKILLYVIGVIVAVSLLLNQSPWAFLGGIGAATAVLLLIFRDTILSFVASIQIANNDMVRVGDWIQMDKYGADGDVVEIALNTIKVQNWDKTITTIPTFKLVEDSFKNWRGMQQSGGRRIARSLMIDQATVRFLDEPLFERLGRIAVLRPYLERRRAEVQAWNEERGLDTSEVLNGRRLTNIGTFRAYVVAYLQSHPRINPKMTFLIRQLEPTPDGIPLQVYVFTDTVVWAEYEDVQSDVFDHLLAAVSEFDLAVYQHPSGRDIRSLRRGLAAPPEPERPGATG